MDKFEKQLNRVSMTPKAQLIPPSTIKQTDQQKSYMTVDFNEHDSENLNLRSQITILEGKLQFYEREFQIKQQSMEKRIQNQIQTSSQLTQQNSLLQMQQQTLLMENQSLHDKLMMYEQNSFQFDEKVHQQLEQAQRYQEENEKLSIYANECRERSKQRKQKIKDLTQLNTELQKQVVHLSKDENHLLKERDSLIAQFQQQITHLQEQNEDAQLKYEQLLNNIKNHIQDGEEESLLEQQKQPLIDEQYLAQIQEQFEFYEQLQTEINSFISQSHNQNIIQTQFQNPQIEQITQIFNRLVDQNLQLQEKKQKYKQAIQEQKKRLEQVTQHFDSEQRTKLLFEQRIIELEQQQIIQIRYYLKDEGSANKRRSRTTPFKPELKKNDNLILIINRMLSNYLQEYIQYNDHLRELNFELSSPNNNNHELSKIRKFRKSVWVMVFVARIQRQTHSHRDNQLISISQLRPLRIKMPIINTLHQFLELFGTQQQIIETFQKNPQPKLNIDGVENKLREEIVSLQKEFNCYKEVMNDYQKKMQYEIEERERQIEDLISYKGFEVILSEQWNRVKQIEHEFIQLNELVDQFH